MRPSPEDFLTGQVLLINKPLGWTSFDVVNKIRWVLRKYTGNKKIKVGHAGTLDPLATGLLIVCTGKFTKRIDELQGMPKSYRATIKLGAETPSYDAETEPSHTYDISQLSIEDVKAAMLNFVGELDQFPPMYSAIKHDGKKLYELARKGETVEMRSRKVTITRFEVLENRWPELVVEIDCSKGTYIRSLAHDLGKALNNGAYLTGLVRTAIGDYSLADARELAEWVGEISEISE
jgi:tRNA pseudouridine55 synthase